MKYKLTVGVNNVVNKFTSCYLHISGNHTIAVVQGAENYETLRDCFKEVFKEINDVQECGFISVDSQNIPVELFLGGDYKVSIQTNDFVHELII